jgi:hypothetical protein
MPDIASAYTINQSKGTQPMIGQSETFARGLKSGDSDTKLKVSLDMIALGTEQGHYRPYTHPTAQGVTSEICLAAWFTWFLPVSGPGSLAFLLIP